ncbi:hypothetical protein OL599_12500 [Rhodovastum sp. RN2-1]|uniref:Uncharacterized protein n=1 Tax=Limobrevibacterium gyesilva TaxID=2991712 RepID=A0AA41YME2_9PROT|nr:hypothetical protein [Limobrevibacterium gyesilva]
MSQPAAGRALLADLYPRIVKPVGTLVVPPNLADYQRVRSEFTWQGGARCWMDCPVVMDSTSLTKRLIVTPKGHVRIVMRCAGSVVAATAGSSHIAT